MKIKNNKGFTLIELLIVVAIIAILAAIAIPQFAQYRIRGYNSSGLSDLRNTRTSEEALFADWQRYGSTISEALPFATSNPAGVMVTGPGVPPAVLGLTLTDAGLTVRGIQIAVGNNVTVWALNEAAAAVTYSIGAKHISGDTMYACETEATSNWRQQGPATWVGTTVTTVPAPGVMPVATTAINIAAPWTQM